MRDLQEDIGVADSVGFLPTKTHSSSETIFSSIDEGFHRYLGMYACHGITVWFSLRIHVVDRKAVYPGVRHDDGERLLYQEPIVNISAS